MLFSIDCDFTCFFVPCVCGNMPTVNAFTDSISFFVLSLSEV